ncbi:MAG: methyl-accepting chemotaxis protein [Acidocella sp.]|nr:methyl-accepting chemotaxis protein [Acidocella sp.]
MAFAVLPLLVFAAVTVGLTVKWHFKRLTVINQRLEAAVETAQEKNAAMVAQNGLDRNLDMLRNALQALGLPRQDGERLYFGNHCLNGDCTIVDQVKLQYGGTATIFLGDERVATNVQTTYGSRALGTKLAPGPAYERVLTQGLSYRGEAVILGESYVAVYEPIIADGAVIGMLFVGVKTMAGRRAAGPPRDFEACIKALDEVTQAHAQTAQQAVRQRQEYEDSRRKIDAERLWDAKRQSEAVIALADALDHLAKGDLAFRLEAALASDYEKLRDNFNSAIAQLHATIEAVGCNTRDVGNGAEEIRGASDDLSGRITQQAATLEQTAAALDAITSTVRQTATAALTARSAVTLAHEEAQTSNEVLRETVTAMEGIAAQSREITNTIGVIDDIAFQTNILALNAGVEAARAGEAGRGFAVVASEVRVLAQRSAEAAKSIKILIATSGQQVGQGVKLVDEAAGALERIVEQVNRLSLLVNNIAGAAQEQASSLSEVNLAVNQMDQSTQRNATMVQETLRASNQLAHQASELSERLQQFRTGPERTGPERTGPERTSASIITLPVRQRNAQ